MDPAVRVSTAKKRLLSSSNSLNVCKIILRRGRSWSCDRTVSVPIFGKVYTVITKRLSHDLLARGCIKPDGLHVKQVAAVFPVDLPLPSTLSGSHLEEDGHRGCGFQDAVKKLVTFLQDSGPDFVTFNESLVDQTMWEREAEIKDIVRAAHWAKCQASLYSLVSDFTSRAASHAVFGSGVAEWPVDYFGDLWTLDKHWFSLSLGIPRLVPWPGLIDGNYSRKLLLSRMSSLHGDYAQQLMRSSNMQAIRDNSDNLSEVFLQRLSVFHERKFSVEQRAALDSRLLWKCVSCVKAS